MAIPNHYFQQHWNQENVYRSFFLLHVREILFQSPYVNHRHGEITHKEYVANSFYDYVQSGKTLGHTMMKTSWFIQSEKYPFFMELAVAAGKPLPFAKEQRVPSKTTYEESYRFHTIEYTTADYDWRCREIKFFIRQNYVHLLPFGIRQWFRALS